MDENENCVCWWRGMSSITHTWIDSTESKKIKYCGDQHSCWIIVISIQGKPFLSLSLSPSRSLCTHSKLNWTHKSEKVRAIWKFCHSLGEFVINPWQSRLIFDSTISALFERRFTVEKCCRQMLPASSEHIWICCRCCQRYCYRLPDTKHHYCSAVISLYFLLKRESSIKARIKSWLKITLQLPFSFHFFSVRSIVPMGEPQMPNRNIIIIHNHRHHHRRPILRYTCIQIHYDISLVTCILCYYCKYLHTRLCLVLLHIAIQHTWG